MKKLLGPSMMCADAGNLMQEIHRLEQAGADFLHIDLMDGTFVPNFSMGLPEIEYIAKHATIPTDIHLMINEPSRYVEKFIALGIDIIYIHPEAEVHTLRTLQQIIDLGGTPGIAINPGTTAESIRPLLHLAQYVLVMTVNPGFAGQDYLPFVDEKLKTLSAWKETFHYRLVIDGAVSPQRIQTLFPLGVDGFVLGTSSLFGQEKEYQEIMQELRTL